MKRSKKDSVYRLDPLRHAMNAGKEAKVRALLRVWRQVAVAEAALQWRVFFETGAWQESGPARFTDRVIARQHQMVRDQVVGTLDSWLSNRAREFTVMVARSGVPENLRHQLHFINRWQAWFSREPLAMKDGSAVPPETRVLARRMMKRIMARHRRPRFHRASMIVDARGADVREATNATAFPLWLRFHTTTPRERIEIPLLLHRYAKERPGTRRRTRT